MQNERSSVPASGGCAERGNGETKNASRSRNGQKTLILLVETGKRGKRKEIYSLLRFGLICISPYASGGFLPEFSVALFSTPFRPFPRFGQ